MVFCVFGRAEERNIYNKHITNFTKVYPNMAEILITDYDLNINDKILVMETRRVDLPHYKSYQTKFKKAFFGTVEEFKVFVRELCEETIWSKNYVKISKFDTKKLGEKSKQGQVL